MPGMHDRIRREIRFSNFISVLAYATFLLLRVGGVQQLTSSGQISFLILRIFSLVHWVLIVILAGAIGHTFLSRIQPSAKNTPLLALTLSTTLGFGILATLLSALGFLQILSVFTVQGLILILMAIFGIQCSEFIKRSQLLILDALRTLRVSNPTTKFLGVFGLILTLLTLLNTLSPPWDYDGLMYHLLGPQQFLDAGGFFPDLENWYVNGPFSIEMLFTIGLSLGDDVFPKLIHFAFWIIFSLATFSWAKQWFSKPVAGIALALLLGVPALPIWASFAYIDLAWSLFEFLAFACLFTWWDDEDQSWLILAGSFTGMAMASKYLGLFGAFILGLFFLYIVWNRKRQLFSRELAALVLPAAGFAFPWYLKNLLWLNNPIYPLVWGGPAWDSVRLDLYHAYLGSFGLGKDILDFVLLPWNVYAHNESFGAVMNRNDIPNVLFLLALFSPLLIKDKRVRLLSLFCLLRLGVWYLGSQQLRFLVPIYPILSILGALSIFALSARFSVRRSLQDFLPILSIALIFIPAFYQVQIVRQYRTIDVLFGLESDQDYLHRAVGDYAATQFIREDLPETARVLLLGDGRGYYCGPKCIPDPDHFHFARQIVDLKPSTSISTWLTEMNVTYLMISIEDLDFLLQHDPTGTMRTALERISSIPLDGCFEQVYEDRWVEIYAVSCASNR